MTVRLGLKTSKYLDLTKNEKTRNTKCKITDEELKALAKEKANIPMQLMTILLSQIHHHFNYLLMHFMSYRKNENLKKHVYVKNIKSGEVKRVIEEKEELIRGYGWANDAD